MELESKGPKQWVSFDSEAGDAALSHDGPEPEIEAIEAKEAPPQAITPLPTVILADPARLMTSTQDQVSQKPKKPIPHIDEEGSSLTKNGKIVATIYPENTHCAWIIPPRYNPYNVPAILAAGGLEIPAEDFITSMELITNDYRFRCYSTLYGRLIALWLTFSLLILLTVMFTAPGKGLTVFIFCIVWSFSLFAGIIGCAIIRKQIRIGLRHAVQSANKVLLKHGFLAGIEDRGQISCHKVVIHIMRFDATECSRDIERLLRIEATGGAVVGGEGGPGLHPPKPGTPTSVKEIEERAKALILKYSQGYVKSTVRNRIVFPSRPTHGVSEFAPKHCKRQLCVCQFVEKKHFNRKPARWYERLV